jgi:hypothetical protein
VVSCGLFLSRRSSRFFTPGVRLQIWAVWEALTFILNGLVFVLLASNFRRVGRHSRVRPGESPLVRPELRRTSNSPEDFLGISRDEGCAGYPKKIPSSADSACLRQKHSDPTAGQACAESSLLLPRSHLPQTLQDGSPVPGTKSNHLPCILRNPRHPRAPGAHSSFTGNEVWHGSSQTRRTRRRAPRVAIWSRLP